MKRLITVEFKDDTRTPVSYWSDGCVDMSTTDEIVTIVHNDGTVFVPVDRIHIISINKAKEES